MNDLILKNKNEYTLKTAEGQENLREYIENYNKNLDETDPLSRKIGYDEALAITNIEEFIKNKSALIEIVREALEIAFTSQNFKTNNVFGFLRRQLKKLNYNSIVRMQVENYVNFRMHQTDKSIEQEKTQINYENITSFELNGEKYYYNILTNEELTGEDLKKYLAFVECQKVDCLPF